MNSLLSALSGQFSKSLLLSTFLPVVVFVLLGLVLVFPRLPIGFLSAIDSRRFNNI
jgi:hypothetical protein